MIPSGGTKRKWQCCSAPVLSLLEPSCINQGQYCRSVNLRVKLGLLCAGSRPCMMTSAQSSFMEGDDVLSHRLCQKYTVSTGIPINEETEFRTLGLVN